MIKVFLSIIFLLPFTHSYTNNGFSISDLEYTDGNFVTEANTWAASGLAGSNIYWYCGSYMLGGYGILQSGCSLYYGIGGWCNQWGQYFTKTYTNLPPHSYISFSSTWWALYTWDYPTDYFQIYFDSYIITSFSTDQSAFPSTCCGLMCIPGFFIYGRFAHSASTLTVTFMSRMDESSANEAWGVRDLDLLFTSTASSTYTCAAPNSIPYLPSSWRCSCGTPGYYGSSCTQCDPSCKSCYAGGSNSCFACASGYSWNGANCIKCHPYCSVCYGTGNDQCNSCNSGYYLWAGNTCIASCSPPLVQSASSSSLVQLPALAQTVCSYPCTQGFYLDWNGNCQGSCAFPLQATTVATSQGPIYVCNYPCATTQYLYWDGMCENSCDPPLYITTYNGRNMCNFPCQTASNPIAYWDGSCNNTCAFPLIYVISHSEQFCTDPCTTAGYYLYNNGSCLATCQKYFVPALFAGKLFCDYPCTSGNYLYSNGSCLSTCNSPFYNLTMLADKYCYYPCLPTEYLYNNGSCITYCDWRFNVRVLVAEQYCDYPCAVGKYLYLNGSCLAYCRTYYTPWFDKYASTNYYCDNPCNTSIMLNNGTCVATCDSRYISYKGGSDKFCDYPCEPSQYLYTNGSCLLTCVPYYHPSNYLGDRFCDNPCTSGQYIYYNGSCESGCSSPFTAITAGTDLLCQSPCKAGDYLYNNYTCLSWCTPDFIESSYGSELFCNYPCAAAQYLYQDGTCQSSCRPYFTPATYGTDKFCFYPCDPSKSLYSNGSCLSTCNSLFIEVTVNATGLKYCNNPCSTTTDFIYWDGTCQSSCSSPLMQYTEGVNNFCVYPCTQGEYLYWNSSCLSDCEFPLVSTTQDGLLYCKYPCITSEYLRWDGECVTSCSSPLEIYIQGSEIRCLPPCENRAEYYYEETGQCSTYCEASLRVTGGLYLICSSLIASDFSGFLNYLSSPPSDSRSISFITVARQIQYIKYLDIYIPPKLLRLTEGKANPPLSLNTGGLIIPEDATPTFYRHILPVVFWEQGLSFGFLANFWLQLMVLGILIVLGVIVYCFEIACKNAQWRDWQEIFERFRVIILWNLIIMLLATNIDSIILYSSLEFRVLSLNSTVEIFSFICCLLIVILPASIILVSCVFAAKLKITKSPQSNRNSYNSYSTFLVRWQTLQVVYRGFRENTFFQGIFYLIYLLRISFQGLIAAFLYTSPITQSVLYITISIAILWYLLHADPLKKRINQVQLALTEALVLAVNICFLILSISDAQNYDNYSLRISLGNIIILCNFGLNTVGVTFLALKLIMGIFTILKLKKKKGPYSAKAAMFQLLFLPFQQAAFGFEQVQVTRFIHEYSKLKMEGHKNSSQGNKLKDQVLKSELFSPLTTVREDLRLINTQYTGSDTNLEESNVSSAFPIRRITTKKFSPSKIYPFD